MPSTTPDEELLPTKCLRALDEIRSLLAHARTDAVALVDLIARACDKALPTAATPLASLQDPVAVHANMLRGSIAKPTVPNIWHLYGEKALLDEAPDHIREQLGRKDAALRRARPFVEQAAAITRRAAELGAPGAPELSAEDEAALAEATAALQPPSSKEATDEQ